jgi:hypothetical protein
MDTEGEPLPSPAETSEKKPRGRPRQPAAETQKQRIERLQAELREAQAAMKLTEEKRAGIVGAAAIRHARHNAQFARQLAAALRAEIKSKVERAAVGDLLAE